MVLQKFDEMPNDELVRDFDPMRNEFDRRLFYEVTGDRLIEGEFMDEDTSDAEDDQINEPGSIDPLLRRVVEPFPNGSSIN